MELRAYNRQIREQLISEARAPGYAEGYAQGYAKARAQVRAAGRRKILDELRSKTPEEIRQILERDDQTDGSPHNCG